MAGTYVLRVKLIIISLIFLTAVWSSTQLAVRGESQTWLRFASGLIGLTSILLSLLSLWMASLRISHGHSLTSAYLQVFVRALLMYIGYSKLKVCSEAWKNPRKTQENLLKKIIEKNRNTEYVKDFGLDSVHSLNELKAKHPLTSYERYRPYVDRMARGEKDILMGEELVRFGITSGTTGKSKMVPYSKSVRDIIATIYGINVHARGIAFGYDYFLQREMMLYTSPKQRFTESGIPIAPSGMIPRSMERFLVIHSTPSEGFQIQEPSDALYVHLLFGLRDPNLYAINGTFTSRVMTAMRMMEQRWPDFVRDIECGTVTTVTVPPEIHRVLVEEMGGRNPKRAAELKLEFEKGFEGIVQRIWPLLKFVQATDTVGIKGALRNSHLKGVPLYSRTFSSTEGVIGMNLWLRSEKDEFVLMPNMCVLEFIPEAKIHEEQPDTLFIDQLEVGGVYEIVISQKLGFYRFRYGDVIEVTRYHFNTPVVRFMYRSCQILNVRYEKLDQRIVKKAMEAAVDQWANVKLDNYAVAESFLFDEIEAPDADYRPFYIVFLELHPPLEEEAWETISLNKVDEELRNHSATYNMFRDEGSVALPYVHIVKPGTFDRLFEFILDHSTTSANQYKVPRKLRTVETLKLMLEGSVYSNRN